MVVYNLVILSQTNKPRIIIKAFKLGLAFCVIVITFFSPSCLGQTTANGPVGLRVKLPPAHLFITYSKGFTLSLY